MRLSVRFLRFGAGSLLVYSFHSMPRVFSSSITASYRGFFDVCRSIIYPALAATFESVLQFSTTQSKFDYGFSHFVTFMFWSGYCIAILFLECYLVDVNASSPDEKVSSFVVGEFLMGLFRLLCHMCQVIFNWRFEFEFQQLARDQFARRIIPLCMLLALIEISILSATHVRRIGFNACVKCEGILFRGRFQIECSYHGDSAYFDAIYNTTQAFLSNRQSQVTTEPVIRTIAHNSHDHILVRGNAENTFNCRYLVYSNNGVDVACLILLVIPFGLCLPIFFHNLCDIYGKRYKDRRIMPVTN